MKFSLLKKVEYGPEQLLRPRGGFQGHFVVARKIASLQLADPIPALGDRMIGVAGQMTLERKFLDLLAVEGAEFQRRSAERPNQCELSVYGIDNESEFRLLCKCQAKFACALNLTQ